MDRCLAQHRIIKKNKNKNKQTKSLADQKQLVTILFCYAT